MATEKLTGMLVGMLARSFCFAEVGLLYFALLPSFPCFRAGALLGLFLDFRGLLDFWEMAKLNFPVFFHCLFGGL